MGAFDLLAKGAAKGAKKVAPFFSKVDEVLDSLPRNKGTGDEFLREIEKIKGVKPAEIQDRGIAKALRGKPKMTKAEVKKIFESNPPPRVQEKVLSSDVPDYDEWLDAKALEMYGDEYHMLSRLEQSKLNKMYGDLDLTQYDRYKTPGGENYREILLKLPAFDSKRIMELESDIRRIEGSYRDPMSVPDFRAKVDELAQLKEQQAAAGTPYVSSHYKTDPNLLAHIRVQDFTTPEGKKILLVDEIQSDWHQKGRKGGYYTKEQREAAKQAMKEWKLKNQGALFTGPDQFAKEHPEYAWMNDAVPDAPFKKNWHELAMKRVLDYAAGNGYDTVAITPGAEQAKRYDLSKQVEQIMSVKEDGGVRIFARDNRGKNHDMGVFPPDQLSGVVGKDLAEKIAAQEKPTDIYQGVDLQVGGEGMKGFYDKILPDYLNNFGKQYGAQTGQISLRTPSAGSWNIEDAARFHGMSGADYLDSPNRSQLEKQFLESRDNQTTGFHSFDITPQLRDEVKNKGLPLYSKTGMGPEGLAAGTGAATIGSEVFDTNNEQQVQNPVHFTENPDAMLLELMQRN